MKKSSLVIVTDMPPDTGIGRYAYRLFKEISKRIYNVSFLYTGYLNLPSEEGFVNYSQRYKSSNIFQKTFSKYYNFLSAKKLEFLRNSNIHLCGSSYNLANYVNDAVATIHDLYYVGIDLKDFISPESFIKKLAFDINTFNTHKSLTKVPEIVTIANTVRKQLKQKTGRDSEVIHHWIDDDIFHKRSKTTARELLSLPVEKSILLNVSGCGPNKNLSLLTKIVDKLPKNYVLVKIGCPIKSERVVNINKLSADLYPLIFNAADMYIHTSTFEGFGIPLIESLGSGLPVISLDTPTSREVLGDAPVYFKSPTDQDELLTSIYTSVGTEKLKELSALSISRSRVFSKNTIIDRYLEFYKKSLPDIDSFIIQDTL